MRLSKDIIKKILYFLVDNKGEEFTKNELSKELDLDWRTIGRYLNYLVISSFVIGKKPKYNISFYQINPKLNKEDLKDIDKIYLELKKYHDFNIQRYTELDQLRIERLGELVKMYDDLLKNTPKNLSKKDLKKAKELTEKIYRKAKKNRVALS